MAITPKQQAFVEQYLVDLNATQAAIRAGYSAKTANEQGARLLANASVATAVKEAIDARTQRTEASQDAVVAELAKMGFANMLDYIMVHPNGMAHVDLSRLTRDQAAAISEVTVDEYTEGGGEDARVVKRIKFKLADKRGSLELLGRHLGMFKNDVNLNVKLTDYDKLSTPELLAKAKELGVKGAK